MHSPQKADRSQRDFSGRIAGRRVSHYQRPPRPYFRGDKSAIQRV